MGGFLLEIPQKSLTPQGVLGLADLGEAMIFKTTKVSIMDRSKADGLGKVLICLQAIWMIIQCIGRLVSHLPLTLLKINTLGHVFCALSLYAIWYHKPQDMNDPIRLNVTVSNFEDEDNSGGSDNTRSVLREANDEDSISPSPVAQELNQSLKHKPFLTALGVPNFAIKEFSESFTVQRHLVFCLASSLFGLLHVAAWNSQFPSLIEKLLWRSAAVYVTGSGILIACFLLFIHVSSNASTVFTYILVFSMLVCAPILYVGARLFLIIEAFLSLRALPPQAYQTPNWTISIPHL